MGRAGLPPKPPGGGGGGGGGESVLGLQASLPVLLAIHSVSWLVNTSLTSAFVIAWLAPSVSMPASVSLSLFL